MNTQQNTTNRQNRQRFAHWAKVAGAVAVAAFAAFGAAYPAAASHPIDDPVTNTVSTTYEPATYPCFIQPTPDRWPDDAGAVPRCAHSFDEVARSVG